MTRVLRRPIRIVSRSAAAAAGMALIALCLLPAAPAAGDPRELSLEVPEVAAPPRLEDFLGDIPAVRALRIESFVQRHPQDGTAATGETVAYLTRDSSLQGASMQTCWPRTS